MNLMLTDPDVLADYVNDFWSRRSLSDRDPEETQVREQAAARAHEAEIQARATERCPATSSVLNGGHPGRQVNPANDFWATLAN